MGGVISPYVGNYSIRNKHERTKSFGISRNGPPVFDGKIIQYGRPHDFVGELIRKKLTGFVYFYHLLTLKVFCALTLKVEVWGFPCVILDSKNFLFPDSFKKAKDREEALLSDSTTKGGVASDLSPSTGKSSRKAAVAGRAFLKKVTSADEQIVTQSVSCFCQ